MMQARFFDSSLKRPEPEFYHTDPYDMTLCDRFLSPQAGEAIRFQFEFYRDGVNFEMLVIHDAYKKQGIGRSIVTGLCNLAREMGYPYLWLEAQELGRLVWPKVLGAVPISISSSHFFKSSAEKKEELLRQIPELCQAEWLSLREKLLTTARKATSYSTITEAEQTIVIDFLKTHSEVTDMQELVELPMLASLLDYDDNAEGINMVVDLKMVAA